MEFNNMIKYKSIPVDVEAVRWDGSVRNAAAIILYAEQKGYAAILSTSGSPKFERELMIQDPGDRGMVRLNENIVLVWLPELDRFQGWSVDKFNAGWERQDIPVVSEQEPGVWRA